jgi:hypothetical protein
MGNMSSSTAVAGAPISGFGIRVDLDALGVRDNSYRSGGNWIAPGNPPNYSRGTTDFDGPRAVVGKATWKDYTYTVDLRSLDDDGLGIVFRYIDENNFYRLMFMSQSGNTLGPPPRGISVQKRLDGAYSEVFYNGTSFIYTPGQRWRTQLTATGSHFDIQVTELDGPAAGTVHNFSFDDPVDPILRGKVGVTAWGAHAAANEDNALLGGLDWTQNFFEGAVFDNVLVVGTMTRVVPDLNDDQFVNADDLILWGPCVTGPGIPAVNPTEACQKADVDGDGDVDQDDFGYFQRCFTGSLDIPVDETCVD